MEKLEAIKREKDETKFSSVQITITKHVTGINQWNYIAIVKSIPPDETFSDFRFSRANLSWIVYISPVIACYVPFAEQVTEETYLNESIKNNNRVITDFRKSRHIISNYKNVKIMNYT